MIIEQKSLDVSLDSEKDYDNTILYFILSALHWRLFNIYIYIYKKKKKKKKKKKLNLMMGNEDN